MAELYEKPKLYANAPAGVTPISGDPDLDKVLSELPPEERDEAMRKITAPPSGEEIAQAMMERNANGEMFNMNLEQYRLLKAHNKNKEVDIISTFGQAAGGIYDELMKAAGSVANNPADALSKVTPSLIEAFAQGTRSLYGMAAQSVDPTSVMFRMKNALSANGSDEEAEYSQFMEAQRFNVHSMNLMSGKETLIMDKDAINPEMTQVMSYVADPTLFIPFGGIAAKGAKIIGMGEGLAKASARASAIRNKVLGGTLKWGVGAPIEFLGNATRNTIDYGLERSASAFEFATGLSAAEAQATARQFGLNSVAGSLAGQTVPIPIVGNIAGAMVGATSAAGVGEAIGMLGEQMIKQQKNGRGVLSYAGQAIRDSEKAGIKMSAHARGLLRVIDMADPLFVYGMDIAEGAGTGMAIGGGLGYLSGGEEGMASGAGAGFALGAVGAGAGSLTADITNNRLYDRVAIQRKMVIEGLKGTDDLKATALEAYVASAEDTGDRRYMAEVDGMIAGIDLMSPNSKWNIRTEVEHKAWLESLKIDPKTGRLKETTAILPQFGADRKSRASALSFLSMVSDNFSGLPENLRQHIDALPADHAMKKHWARLPDAVKKVVMDEVKQNANIEYRKQFGGKKANEFYGDINYAEAHTARINSLFDSGNPTQAKERINMLLKEETKGGKLTKRGELLKEKLATEGYFDKDGNMRPSRLKDVEMTEDVYKYVAGFVIRRDSTGQVEINLNLNQMGRDTAVHELFHAIMLESPMKDEFIDRLSTKLLGKFDANGKRLEGASVDTNQVKKFFQRYIDSLHRNNPTERANETTRLQRAIEEYEQRGDQNKVNRTTSTTLEDLVEEFGAFYFPKFIQDKPVDFLFRGGELGAMREMFQSVKFGWLDFWREKIGTRNPELNFDAVQGYAISKAFGKDGQPRYKNKALDLFMQDFVRATAMANRNGQFDITRLSNDAQKTFIKNNGIRGYGTIDKDGKVVRLNRRTALKEEMRVGKEIYKIVAGIDPKYRQGLTIDGEGNFSGRISPELAEELVKSGHVDRAWVDKLLRAYDIVDGKGSNVIEFGYLGRTAQIGDYAWPRLVGSDVPFKNRKAILLDVDFKIGKDGRMTALYHTLDHAVIEGRANTLWSDPAVRQLWDGDRGSMEADFFRYLSNASLPSDHPDRVSSAKLLEDGTGKGAMRRNAMHQMLGMAKLDGDVYINKPIAEIPLGIRHSVTTFNVDGVSGLRVRDGARYDYNHRNAFRDLSRNFMMSEMASEETPNGKILKHGTGYKITKMAGSNRFSVFDVDGKELGRFDTLADAGRAAQKDYNAKFDAKVEGKDVPVPRTEIPPSRQAYIESRLEERWKQLPFVEELKNLILDKLRLVEKDFTEDHPWQRSTRSRIEQLEKEGLTHKNIDDFDAIGIKKTLENGDTVSSTVRSYVLNKFRILGIDDLNKSIGAEYDAMYPMEIKSALHGRLAQIFQDYPNLTAQGLLKKLDVYGSQGYRYLQEAKEIGLVDLLKSKIKPKTEIYRKMDAQGNFTGEVATRELPVLFREISVELKDEDGKVLTDENGYPIKETRQTNENIQGTQPVLDMQEILDFAKSKEIKVTIEEGAREVNNMDTERLTLGGDKSNYKQTAIRINPEYAHGIRGHYGENTIVHFRTTERLDAEGNKVLFIEEVQANNTDIESKQTRYTEAEVKVQEDLVKVRKNILKELKQAGVFVYANQYLVNQREAILSIDNQSTTELRTVIRDAVRKEITGTGFDYAMDRDRVKNKFYDDIFEVFESTRADDYREIFDDLNERFIDEQEYNIWQNIKQSKHLKDIAKRLADHNSREKEAFARLEKEKEASGIELYQLKDPNRLKELIEDAETRSRQMRNSMAQAEKTYPLTQAKDWTLTALKGIIRQAIRDGLDTITLTHPDDSPTVSHMKEKARRGLYGKTIPEIWGSWLRKYGIEIVQQNKLRDASLETYRKNLVEVQNKIPEANEAVMDRFQQVMSGENSQNIIDLSGLLATPVHEITDTHLVRMVDRAQQINDVELRNRVNDLIRLKGTELKNYNAIEVVRAEGIKAYLDADRNGLGYSIYAPQNTSAEAIDRGMTFKLNDAIKQDFLSGKIKTHAMPTEGEGMYQGGRTYNQNGKKWKTGFIGLWAEENPDRLKGKNIEFFKKADGSYRIRMQDNSSGQTRDVGHITASISQNIATLSSNIDPAFRGNKLSYALYSEMAERLRAMGVERVEGQIVNKDGVPIKIREAIIGDTRDYFSGRLISQAEGARRIREKQKMVGSMGGVDVYNELYQNARYQPSEAEKAPVKWIKDRFYTEGYNSEVIWMTPERFLKLASPLGDRVNDEASRARIDAIKRTLQREGSDMDMPYFQIMRNEDGELQVNQHEGRHRAIALLELYGDKKIPVELAMTEGLKLDNIGDRDWDYSGRRAKLKPESERKKGTISKQFKALEDTPLLNQLGTGRYQPAEGGRLKQAAEKAFGMPIIEDATIAGLSSQKGYQGQFKSKSLLQGTFDSYKSLLGQSDARIDKYAWKMQDGQKAFDRKQYERERGNYEEKRKKFLKYLQENGGVENVKILDIVKGNLKEYGIDRDTNWMSPDGVLTVDQLFSKYEAEFNREIEENKRYRKQYEEAKAELDESPLLKTFQTGKPVAVKAFHGSPYGEIKGNSFAPEMLGKYTKAASAKNAYFFAGSEKTSRAYIEGGKTLSFDAKVPYDGWIELDYTERHAVEQAIVELYDVYKQGGGRASLDSYAQSIIDDKYQFRDLVDSTLGTETFSTDKVKKGQVFPFFVKFDNPLVFDQGGEAYREKSYFDLIQQAKKEGRDGVIILDTKDGGEYDIIYAVLPSHENNIKLAKPRTYDDQGKQIPLKQRFDLSSKDIRQQPAEGWRDWQSERTSVGSVIKNTAGYLIMVQNGKFKVYNPAKAMIGIYDNEDQAKRRVQKDEPRG